MSAFSELVDAERTARGWSYNDLAVAAGLDKSGVFRLLTDQRPPTIRAVVALGRCFGATSETSAEGWIARLAVVADKQRMATRAITHGRVESLGLTEAAAHRVREKLGDRVRDIVAKTEDEAHTALGSHFKAVWAALAVAGLTFGMVTPSEEEGTQAEGAA